MSEPYETIDPVERLERLNRVIARLTDELTIMYAGIVDMPPLIWAIYIAKKEFEELETTLKKKGKDIEYILKEYKKIYGLDPEAVRKARIDAEILLSIFKTFSPTAQKRTARMYEALLGIQPQTLVQLRGYLKGHRPKLEELEQEE